MFPENPLELDVDAMRRTGYRVIDLLIERMAQLAGEPAWRGASRHDLELALRESAPETGRPFDQAVQRLVDDVLPYAARVDHARFMAFVPGSPTWPAVMADLLASGYNIFQGTWLGSAGPSQVELVVLDWFREWIGLPAEAGGLFLSGGSAANLTALACARLHRTVPDAERLVIYFSAESHSSVEKATRFLGFSSSRVRILPVDGSYCLDLDALRQAVARDRAVGLIPFLVVANGGATSTGAVDPLVEIAAFCRSEDLWMHVDAAYGGFAILTGRGRELLHGLSQADSITLDPHKWLFQPFETGCLMVRDAELLARAFHVAPDYLQDARAGRRREESGTPIEPGPVNFSDRGFQLTRSPRALKVWLSVQVFGLSAFRDAIDRALDLALHAEARISRSSAFQLLSPATLGIVCFRRVPARADEETAIEKLNERLVRGLAASGVGMISSTRLGGRYALRLCILNHRTTRDDVDRVLDWLENTEPGG